MSRITKALEKLFQKHRIVFWFDEERHFRGDFEAVEIAYVAQVELDNNEFGLKYRMLRQDPDQKFLLFHDGPQPADKENWLLDVQLAHTVFRTDKASLWLTELELPYEFKPVLAKHKPFFGLARRRDKLRASVTKTDTQSQILLKMLAVCADADFRLDSVLENLLEELSEDESKRLTLILFRFS